MLGSSRRILILGNSGSGKTHLARRLSREAGIPLHSLDSLFWKAGGCVERRPLAEVHEALDEIMESSTWIVEGSFGDLIRRCTRRANALIFLDPTWEECERNLLSRDHEPEKWKDPELERSRLPALLSWAKDYWTRSDQFSRSYHLELLESFPALRVHVKSRSESDQIQIHPSRS